MTEAEARDFVLGILAAHERTVDVCEAVAVTARDLAAEVKRGGVPPRESLAQTITGAESVLYDLVAVRREIGRLRRAFSEE